MARLLCAVVVLSLTLSVAVADPCDLVSKSLGGAPIFKRTDAIDCLNTIPYDATRASTLIDTISTYLNAYAYRDYNKDSGPPYNINIDIQADLAELKTKVNGYTTDRAFQEDLASLFTPMHDAHTQYVKPTCYAAAWIVPLQFNSKLNSNGTQIVSTVPWALNSKLQTAYDNLFDVTSSTWANRDIVSIDGMNPIDAIQLLPEVISKDPGPRFNNLIKMDFAVRVGQMIDAPTGPLVITFSNGEKVSIEWMAMFYKATSAPSSLDEVTAMCANPNPPAQTSSKSGRDALVDLVKPSPFGFVDNNPHAIRADMMDSINRILEQAIPGEAKNEKPASAFTKLHTMAKADSPVSSTTFPKGHILQSIGGWTAITPDTNSVISVVKKSFKSLNNEVVCVAKVPSFSLPADPENPNQLDPDGLDEVPQAYEAMVSNKCGYIVFDVIGNPGGMICFGYRLMSLFMDVFTDKSDGQYDIIHAQWMEDLMQWSDDNQIQTGFGSSQYIDPETHKAFEGTDFYANGPSHTRGGATSKYSKKSQLPCDSATFPIWKRSNVRWPSARIAILSDGTCGSTCELFVSKMSSLGDVTTAAVGGIWGKSMDPASFAGGNVLQAGQVEQIIDQIQDKMGGLQNGMPSKFDQSYYPTLTFNFREMYSYLHPTEIVEWQWRPATSRIPQWNWNTANDFVNVYDATVDASDELFNAYKCEDDTSVPCSQDNGKAGSYKCAGGVLDLEHCTDVVEVGTGGGDGPTPEGGSKGVSKSTFYLVAGGAGAAIVVLIVAIIVVANKRSAPPAQLRSELIGHA